MAISSKNVRILSAMVLVALAVRALIPPGFMLASADASSGGLTVVICTAEGMQRVSLDADSNPVEVPHPERADSACEFGPTPLGIAAHDPNADVVPPLPPAATAYWSHHQPPMRRVSLRRARAPPAPSTV